MRLISSILGARVNNDLSMEFLCCEFLMRLERPNIWVRSKLVEKTRTRWISSREIGPVCSEQIQKYLQGLDTKTLDLLSRGNDAYIQSLIRAARDRTDGGRRHREHDNNEHDNSFKRSEGRREEPRHRAPCEPPVDPKTQKCRDFLKAASLDTMRLNRFIVVARCYKIDYDYHAVQIEVCGTDTIEDVKYFFQAKVGIDVSRCTTKWSGIHLSDCAALGDINILKSCVLCFIEPRVRFAK